MKKIPTSYARTTGSTVRTQRKAKITTCLLVAFFVVASLPVAAQNLQVGTLVCEYLKNPLAVHVLKPRLSWKLTSPLRNVRQAMYELRVSSSPKDIGSGKNIVWETGKIKSDQSVHVPYDGPPLQSGKRYYWQVRVWDQDGHRSEWSDVNYWQMGLLNPSDWTAKWITTVEPDSGRSPMFRKTVSVKKDIRSALAYITAQGLYEATINGTRVGDSYFTPGWTSYNKRIQYQAYDVTGLMTKGTNTIGAVLGGGWYRGAISRNGKKYWYGNELGLLLQIEIEYADGTHATIGSDETWKSAFGPIRYSDIYNGETYDARLEKTGWRKSSYKEDQSWQPVRILETTTGELIGPCSPPVRKQETFGAVKIIETPKGETVVDFGQNLVGWVQLKAQGATGTVITISHAEVLDEEGNFYTANLRAAKQRNTYILNGNGEEKFEPHFTFQGFRYAKIEGYPGKLEADDIQATALYSDLQATGMLTTSNPLVNQLQHNIVWGQKGNFLDIPTDCNQRDERLGWTGDASPFFRTASLNMNVAGFFTKWLSDLEADQHEDGSVPYVIPNVRRWGSGVAGWDDAATIIPWEMYLVYGDERILQHQYESMKAWVGYMENESKEDHLWNTGFHFGDWLSFWPEDRLYKMPAATDKYLIAQAFFIHSTQLLINTAELLGKKDDVEKYSKLLPKLKTAFHDEYVTPNGRLLSDTQTAYVLALNFDILPENERARAAQRLVENIKAYGHLTTGFLGTPYLCPVLSRFGYTDVAYKLLLNEKYPSWLYQVKMGATTIWERWDGIRPDSTLQDPEMNSFNHYHYGVIGEWMYRVMAGIDTDTSADGVGYKVARIAPHPGGNMHNVRAELITLYGTIASEWKMSEEHFDLKISIPANTTARVVLPRAVATKVNEGGSDIEDIKAISDVVQKENSVELTVGSGTYHFEYDF